MKSLVYTIFMLVIVSITGCTGRSTVKALDRAESLMEEHPDSALAVISDIDSTTLRGDKYLAKYALLKTQALVKNDSIITSPDLIRKAVEYYEKKGVSPDLMKSLFYNACVLRNMGNLTSAIKLSTHSYDLARRFDDPYWIAKTAEQLMFIYNSAFNNVEAMKYSKIASEFYKKAGKRLNHLYCMSDYCGYMISNDNFIDAIHNIDSVIDVVRSELNDTNLLLYANRIKLNAYIELNHNSYARKCMDEINDLSGNSSTSTLNSIAESIVRLRDGDYAAAERQFNIIQQDCLGTAHKAALYEGLIELAKRKNDYRTASCYLDSALLLQNNEILQILTNDLGLAQKEYYNEIYKIEENKSKTYRKSASLITLASLILIIILLTIHRFIIKRKDEKLEGKIKDMLILSSRLNDNESARAQLQETLANHKNETLQLKKALSQREIDVQKLKQESISLFKDQWATLNLLCHEYYEKGDSESVRFTIVKSIEREIKNLNSPKSIKKIECLVNNCMDNIIERLRLKCLSIKNEDVTFLILACSGLDARAICFLLGINLKNFYMKRKRLVDRVKKQDSALGEEISGYI
ncbi:MAG: hypothetical protein K2K97_02300 [Muribaculaceae bacterium]|nr:hypothetical protein [Muribaculaceae bacterium]